MEANWKLFGRTHATEYQLARRGTFLKINLDQLTKNVNILRKLCSDQTGKLYNISLYFLFIFNAVLLLLFFCLCEFSTKLLRCNAPFLRNIWHRK